MSVLRPSQENLLRLALETGALLFGSFVTKAGRETPYFFNSAKLSSGRGAWAAGQALSDEAVASGLGFDMLFGAAYKGIPLAALTAAALQQGHNLDLKFAYNRKEAKAHGEGGAVAGAKLEGRVLIVDDVLSAGTSAREAIDLIQGEGAEVAGLLVLLDRQERGLRECSAAQALNDDHGIAVRRVFGLDILLKAAHTAGQDRETIKRVEDYRKKYGAL
ncbi:MAG: orotate phosphoribosyltransferase [Gammaproteobacteria bacterium]|nr:orotate phosphoribosyltransferase [Gammaproteobacteria bacterium]MCY4340130.1 orotate phosphoribosyltransferase [Gammaproteobacteria bacterium]